MRQPFPIPRLTSRLLRAVFLSFLLVNWVDGFSSSIERNRFSASRGKNKLHGAFVKSETRDSAPSLVSSKGSYAIRRHKAPNQKTQLRWIAQSFEKMKLEGRNIPDGVIESIDSLANAKTQDQVIRIGNELSYHIEGKDISPAVKERLIKATATTGLFQLALNLTSTMLANETLPSEITQDALCSSLRRAGRSKQIEDVMGEMGKVARKRNIGVSSSSFNIMLAALCDDHVPVRNTKPSYAKDRTLSLQKAWTWIAQDKAKDELGVIPTSISYATILQAAAKAGNRTLADEVWAAMEERGIQPNPFAYNAMLKLVGKGSLSRDEQILKLWRKMQEDKLVQPDRYTIDLILPALARQEKGEWQEVKAILDNFVAKNSQYVVTNAFAAFFVTLNNAGEMELARELFDLYLKSYFAPVLTGNAGRFRLLSPTTKHFNIILEGYSREITAKQSSKNEDERDEEKLRRAAWDLFRDLLACRGLEPDEFTYSTMMGLASSPKHVCQLLGNATDELLSLSPVLQRSAITAFGELGDAASACWLFSVHTLPSGRTTVREWNVLLGALSKASQSNNTAPIDVWQSPAAVYFNTCQIGEVQSPLAKIVDGLCPGEAAAKILEILVNGSDTLRVVKPDSQSFCLVAAALQNDEMNSTRAMNIFRLATQIGVGADGRFVNAILRCFGQDIQAAVSAWKGEIRPACIRYENRQRWSPPKQSRARGKNLIAAYDGLLYVSGRALRPDIGLKLVYAMTRDGLEPSERMLNSYRSGKRVAQLLLEENRAKAFARKLVFDPYESLLLVECTRYDRNDRRRAGERRVRIIV